MAWHTSVIRDVIKHRAVVVVNYIVERWYIESPADARQSEQDLSLRMVSEDRVDELKSKYFAFANGNNIGEIGDWLRIEKRCGPAHHD